MEAVGDAESSSSVRARVALGVALDCAALDSAQPQALRAAQRQEALAMLSEAAAMDPSNADAHYALGVLQVPVGLAQMFQEPNL